MIGLAVIAWEILTWGLFYAATSYGNTTGAFVFGAAAIVGPLIFIPIMSKMRPREKQETYGDRMRRDAEMAERRERGEQRRLEGVRRAEERRQSRQ